MTTVASPVERYRDLIREKAAKYSVSPNLLAGLVDYESGGNPRAISGAGAIGLGQVMPRERGFSGRPSIAELFDPEINLEWAARILSEGIKRWGTVEQGLAAYLGAIDNSGRIVGGDPYTGVSGTNYVKTILAKAAAFIGWNDAADTQPGGGVPPPNAGPSGTWNIPIGSTPGAGATPGIASPATIAPGDLLNGPDPGEAIRKWWDGVTTPLDFFRKLFSDPATWRRAGLTILGAALLLAGFALYVQGWVPGVQSVTKALASG